MNWVPNQQFVQYISWFLALLELILAFYILLLNARHTANRHTSVLILLVALNSIGTGLLGNGSDVAQAQLSSYLLAVVMPSVGPWLFTTTVVLLQPQWMVRADRNTGRTRLRMGWWLIYGLGFLPLVVTGIDVTLNTGLWYTGLEPGTVAGGALPLGAYAQGLLAPYATMLYLRLLPMASLIPVAYTVLRGKKVTRSTRNLAWLLLAVQVVALGVQLGLPWLLGTGTATLLSGTILALAYAYVAFQQMISERRPQQGRLQTRLTTLVLAIAIPLLVAVVLFVSTSAGDVISRSANQQLEAANRALSINVRLWFDLNAQALQQLVTLPDIASMDPAKQKPILEAMARAHPDMYLVSTTDLYGINVARNDDEAPKDYHDRLWHVGARNGAPITYQTLIGRTSGEPALVVSMPIRRGTGTIVGVGMYASDLDAISQQVEAATIGDTGYAYVVDGLNQVVAHPVAEYAQELRDLDYYPPVFALRGGTRGAYRFTDEEGQTWQANVNELDNGWGVIVQQREEEWLAPLRSLQRSSLLVVALGSAILAGLTTLTVGQMMRPIKGLTETATAIAAGDLTREAPVESQDEIGALARSFNTMTAQLRGLIDSLERQVEERTKDLEKRSSYLEATAEVGQVASSILDMDQLTQETVKMIHDRFGLYYVGLFLVDKDSEWAVLQAGTGEAGRAMLARGHRIHVGEGMIGWTVAHAQPRVALQAGEDVVRLATPELPETRSEAALPLRSRGRVLGALTVQHTQPDAFDEDTLSVLQTMADQVAVALDNARLFAESEAALKVQRRAYGELGRQAWLELLRAHPGWGYRYTGQGVQRTDGELGGELRKAEQTGQVVQGNGSGGSTLAIPLRIRDQVVGVLGFRKEEREGAWSAEETMLLQAFATQFELALDSARLYQDTQRRAARERLTGEITTRIRETLDLETMLKTTAQEIRQALELPEVVIRLTAQPPDGRPDEPPGIRETS